MHLKKAKYITIGFLALVMLIPFSAASAEQWVTLKSWSGSDDMTTEKFDTKASDIRISWKITPTSTLRGFISVWVYDEQGNAVAGSLDHEQDGYSFAHITPGTYYLQIHGRFVNWQVTLEVPQSEKPLGKVFLADLKLVDATGVAVSTPSVGQQVLVQASATNILGKDQQFAYIVQIKDSNGATVMIGWMNGKIPDSQTFDVAQGWVPEGAGKYSVDVFVWQSLSNPTPLTPTPLRTEITVT